MASHLGGGGSSNQIRRPASRRFHTTEGAAAGRQIRIEFETQSTLDDDLHDPFESSAGDIFQRGAPGKRHGQVKFCQNVLDHLAYTMFSRNG